LKAFTKVSRLPEFEKDLKKLSKRFKTLEDDLRIFIDTQLSLFHKLGVDNGGNKSCEHGVGFSLSKPSRGKEAWPFA
jgi:hypothetical protein